MAKYIIRLDDACPTMDWGKWRRMERLLDSYKIKPIVGVIPANQDKDFRYPEKGDFWVLCKNWQNKGWTIAQHGLHHLIKPCGKQKFYQKTHEYRSEYAGVPYADQIANIEKGYQILKQNGIIPKAFFAPAHTYDKQTVLAVASFGGRYQFISDGYSFHPFEQDGMVFLPSLFDTPHKFWFEGVLTFVYHPNNMNGEAFEYLRAFLERYNQDFISADEALDIFPIKKGQGIVGKIVEIAIYAVRKIRAPKMGKCTYV